MTDIWDIKTIRKAALELHLLPGIGGRLWDVVLGGRGLLFQNPDLLGVPVDPGSLAALPTRSPQFPFPLWGGEKTWVAPDRDWPDGAPHAALDSGRYEVVSHTDTRIEMTSKTCPDSGLSVSRCLEVLTSTDFVITHEIRNGARESRRAGIWSVMMLNHPAVVGVPAALADVRPVFGAAGDMVRGDARAVIVACDRQREFKVATPSDAGAVLIRSAAQGLWLACHTKAPGRSDSFAHDLPFEVFNSGDYPYCEAEWHSPERCLAEGESLFLRQDFSIWQDGQTADLTGFPVSARNTIAEMTSCMS